MQDEKNENEHEINEDETATENNTEPEVDWGTKNILPDTSNKAQDKGKKK